MKQQKGFLLILGTAFISGLAIFINKFGVNVANPYIFTGLKNIIVASLAISWLLMMKDWRLVKRLKKDQWAKLAGIGLIGGSLPFLLFFKGLSLTSAAQGSFIHKTMFLFVALLAVFLLKEKISKEFLIGGLTMLAGNFFLLQIGSVNFGWGDLLIFLAVLLWAGESVLSKHVLKDLPARLVIGGRMLFGSFFIVLFWLAIGQAGLVFSLNLSQIGWLLIASVLLFGYVATWYSGLKHINVSVAAAILLLGSPITTLLSFFILGQNVLAGQMLGMILICGAVVLIARPVLRKRYDQAEQNLV